MKDHGTYLPMVWDGNGEPSAHYVNGHVTDEEFRAACINYNSWTDDCIPADAVFEHVYIRTVPSASSDFDCEVRHCAKGRGAKPMTYWEIRPNRGNGS